MKKLIMSLAMVVATFTMSTQYSQAAIECPSIDSCVDDAGLSIKNLRQCTRAANRCAKVNKKTCKRTCKNSKNEGMSLCVSNNIGDNRAKRDCKKMVKEEFAACKREC